MKMETLYGKPVIQNNSLPLTEPVTFGSLSHYIVPEKVIVHAVETEAMIRAIREAYGEHVEIVFTK